MFRVLASVLLVANLAILVEPALARGPTARGSEACEPTTAVPNGMAAQETTDCQDCNTPDCRIMLGCAGIAPAVVHDASIGLIATPAGASFGGPVAPWRGLTVTPDSPPPRA